MTRSDQSNDALSGEARRDRDRLSLALESGQRYQTLFDYVPDGIVIVNPEGQYLDANESACTMLGYARDELLQMHVRDVVAQSDAALVEPSLQEVNARIDHYRNWRLHRKNGSLFEAEVIATMLPDSNILALVRDISERRRTEDSLRETQEKCWIAFQSSPVALVITDADGNYVETNKAFGELTGYSRKEIIGVNVVATGLIDAAERERLLEKAKTANGKLRNEELTIRIRDGSYRTVVLSLTPLMLSGVEHRLSTAIDVTERNALQQQLAQSQKMQALGKLAGGIAHDFNNLLAVIIGNADLARMDLPAPHPALASVNEIARAGQRAKELVQRILTFSRPHEHRLQPLHLQPVVQDAVNMLRSTLPAGIDMQVTTTANLPVVRADASQIYQIILNLATNAWHAMDGQQGRITLSLAPCLIDSIHSAQTELPYGEYVRLSVRDTGKGMTAETVRRIFEPFFTTKASGHGAGLGLAVVHGIMQNHGGAISVESTLGSGTTFHLYFPAITAVVPTPEDAPAIKPSPMGNGEHILYVDDEEALVMLVTRFLTRIGYRVSGFTNPEQALDAFRSEPNEFDLIITDYNMPRLSGVDVAKEIFHIAPDAPVALASGYLRPGEIDTAHALGIQEIIFKPRSIEELGPIVQQLIAARDAKKKEK